MARIRTRAFRYLRRLLLGEIAGKVPANIVRTLEAVSYRDVIREHIAEVATFNEPQIVTYPFPEHFPAQFRRSKAFDVRYFYKLRNVNVSPVCGLAWTPEGDQLLESVGSFYRILLTDYQAETLLPAETLECDEAVAVFNPSDGYYHWMFEILPRFLHMLTLVPEAKILVPHDAPKFLADALNLLFSQEELQTKILYQDRPVRLRNFLLLTHERFTGFTRQDDLNKLRATIKPLVKTAKAEVKSEHVASELLYVSRRKAVARALLNEKELEDALRYLNFRIVYCEDLSWTEQIALFSDARVIVAPHGAGLSNIVWTEQTCAVLEIFPYRHFVDCYAVLSMQLGHTYDYVECDFDSNSNGKITVEEVLRKIDTLSQ